MSLKGEVAVVTGASRGIGKAVALTLADEGCDLCLIARGKEDLEKTAQECEDAGVTAIAVPTDVTEQKQLEAAVEKCVAEFGKVTILINNAGVLRRVSSAEASLVQDWKYSIDVNLMSVMHMTTLCLPHMQKQGHGAVIFIGSIASKMSFKNGAAYAAAKHGLYGFANSVFEDVREDNIKVCTILPGFVNTNLADSPNLDKTKMIQTADIAKSVMFVLQFPSTGCPTEITIRPQRTPYM